MIPPLESPRARVVARHLLVMKPALAREVVEGVPERDPSSRQGNGDGGETRHLQDASLHIDFLRGALQVQDPRTFAGYARWAADVLASRGFDRNSLVQDLERIRDGAIARLQEPDERAFVAEVVQEGLDALGRGSWTEPGAADPTPPPPDPEPLAEIREIYLRAILSGNRRAALGVLDRAIAEGHPIPDLYLHVLARAQHRLGELWQSNRISVADEHMASAVTQSVLSHLYPRLPRPERILGVAVVTGVEGELHQIGANMVADILETDGWSVRFLGTELPHPGIVEAVEKEGATLVAISATMLFSVGAVQELIEHLRAAALREARHLRVIVGGRAFQDSAEAWRVVGADAFATDLRSAREVARTGAA